MSKRRNAIAENWVAYPCSMIESPAMRVLSQSAIRVMHRLEVEHMHHGGAENGRLIVTHDQFEEWGVERNAIAPAIRELEALGFVEITGKGCAGNAGQRKATRYRLTYVNSKRREPQTNEWRKIDTMDNAERTAAMARAAKNQRARDLGRRGARGLAENKTPVRITRTGTSPHNPDRNADSPVRITRTTTPGPHNPDYYLYLGTGRDSVDPPPAPAVIDRQPDTSPRQTLYQVLPSRAGGLPGLSATRWPAGMSPPSPRCATCSRPLSSEASRFCSAECRHQHALAAAEAQRKTGFARGMRK